MANQKNFGYLGNNFQLQLLNQIIFDKKFSGSIMEVIEPTYFDNKYYSIIVQMVKEYHAKYESFPNIATLEQLTISEISQEQARKVIIDTLENVKNAPQEGHEFVQEKALKFCKQQVMKKVLERAQKIIDKGDFENYDALEEMVREGLQVGNMEQDTADVFSDLDDVLAEDYRHPIPMGISGLDNLLSGGLAKGEIGVILAPTGVGKALPISEPVLTPKGWTPMGDLKLGDEVIGSDGKEQYVIGVYPQGTRPIYKVEFSDQTFVNCDEEHLWSVNTLNMRTSKTRKNGKGVYRPNLDFVTMKTSDMINSIKKRGRYNYRLPIVKPVEFESQEVKIDPYLLGVLLGDGSITESGINISTKDEEIINYVNGSEYFGSTSQYHRNETQEIYRVRLKSTIKERLVEYGLFGTKSNTKFIPNEYLFNSSDVRLSLLQGLMDTDGYVSKSNIAQFSSVSKELTDGVRELVLSLGGTARVSSKIPTYTIDGVKKQGQLAYTTTISFSNGVVPFKLMRKIDRFKNRDKYVNQKFIKSITYSHDEEAVCIKVSNPDELFVTRDYVLTHNTTILTKIANNAFNMGFNVLQIFFEDNQKIIQRKHFTLWTGLANSELPAHKDDVMDKVREIRESQPNKLMLRKLPSDTLTMSHIKNYIRKIKSEGVTIDLLVVDYIDCILPDKSMAGADDWKSEGSVMRKFEAMCTELDIAGWTATQGNRSSISSDVVTTDQMGGSIKKAQVGHVIITIAKSLQQKEMNLATIAITKSRIGRDGIVFENCKFNNEFLEIDTEQSVTFLGLEEKKEESAKQRQKELMDRRRQREQTL